MVRTGENLPAGVTLKKSTPGVAFWNPEADPTQTKKARKADGGPDVLLLPDRTVQMTTYAISRLGAGYQWRKNTHDAMDCSALVDRGWFDPLGRRCGCHGRPSGGARRRARIGRHHAARRHRLGTCPAMSCSTSTATTA